MIKKTKTMHSYDSDFDMGKSHAYSLWMNIEFFLYSIVHHIWLDFIQNLRNKKKMKFVKLLYLVI